MGLIFGGIMNSIRKIINWTLWALIIIPVVLIAGYVISEKALLVTPQTVADGIVAFFGAFFAFLFIKLSERLSLIKKGNTNHFNALVDIDRLLNRTFSRLDTNILLLQDDINALRSKKLLVWNILPIPFKYDLADNLKNIDFINDYFALTLDIETLNNDLSTIKVTYDEIKQLYLNKQVSPEIYESNIPSTIKRVAKVIKFMESYKSNAIRLCAMARALLKERDQNIIFVGALPKKHYGKYFQEHTKNELTILEKEVEETKFRSQEEIDKINKSEPIF